MGLLETTARGSRDGADTEQVVIGKARHYNTSQGKENFHPDTVRPQVACQ